MHQYNEAASTELLLRTRLTAWLWNICARLYVNQLCLSYSGVLRLQLCIRRDANANDVRANANLLTCFYALVWLLSWELYHNYADHFSVSYFRVSRCVAADANAKFNGRILWLSTPVQQSGSYWATPCTRLIAQLRNICARLCWCYPLVCLLF